MCNSEKENKPNLFIEEELELQKLRMKAKFGSLMESSGNMSPEAELEWLKHIEKFEDTVNGQKRATVKEILEDLKIKKIEDIPENKLEAELDDIIEKMAEKGICLDVLCDTPAIDIYNFIVTELLPYETDDMRGTGYTTHFTFEEFHPNDAYDINHTAEELITGLCSIEFYDFVKHNLYEEVLDKDGNLILQDDAMEKIRPFGETFENPKIIEWKKIKLEINDEKTEANFELFMKYMVTDRDTHEELFFEGNTKFEMKRDDLGYWSVRRFSIPGLIM